MARKRTQPGAKSLKGWAAALQRGDPDLLNHVIDRVFIPHELACEVANPALMTEQGLRLDGWRLIHSSHTMRVTAHAADPSTIWVLVLSCSV